MTRTSMISRVASSSGLSPRPRLSAFVGMALACAWLQADAAHAQAPDEADTGTPPAHVADETEPQSDATEPQSDATDEPRVRVVSDRRVTPERAERWTERYRRFNTWQGTTGGFRIVDAGSGAPGSFRLQVAGSWMTVADFLHEGDRVDQTAQNLSFSLTPLPFLETFASIEHRTAVTDRHHQPLTDTFKQDVLHVMGDLTLGVKAFHSVLPWLTLGADVTAIFLNQVGDAGVDFSSTTVGLRGNLSTDFRHLPDGDGFPLVARMNLEYVFDQSQELVEGTEDARYERLDASGAARSRRNEVRHLVSRFERFANDVNRTDFFRIGLGLEAPFEVGRDTYLHPLLEWQLGVPVNRQGFDCPQVTGVADIGTQDSTVDSCLGEEGFSAFPQTLTAGLRVAPPVPGLMGFLGIDVGLTGTGVFVHEVAPTAPYTLFFGVGYDYDARPEDIRVVEREIVRKAEPEKDAEPPRGRIEGRVLDRTTGEPIADATVHYPDHEELLPTETDAHGRFISYALSPGEVTLRITHPDYEEGRCSAAIPESGDDVALRCELQQLPREGALKGTVRGPYGTAIAGATVKLEGKLERSLTTDTQGRFSAQMLPPGEYTARVEADGYLIRVRRFAIEPRHTTELEIHLTRRPRRAAVGVRGNEIAGRAGIGFEEGSATLTSDSAGTLAQVADLLLRSPELLTIEIKAPGGRTGAPAENLELARQRAEAVKERLVELGVDEDRLTIAGGASRRVELRIIERAPE